MTTLHEQAIALREDTANKIDRIRSNAQLSDAGKRAAMAGHVLAAKTKLEHMQWQANTYRAERAATLRRQTFGAGASDPMTLMSFRDAAARAAAIDNPTIAARTMASALEAGDTPMARALAKNAAECGWRDVLEQYTTVVPEASAALDEIAQLTPTVQTTLHDGMHFRVDVPSELARLSDDQLQRLADEHTAVAAS